MALVSVMPALREGESVVAGAVARVRLPASEAAWSVLASVARSLTGDVRALVVRPATLETAVTAASSEEYVPADQRSVLDKLAAPDLLSVAVVGGPITGVSLAVALACDLRVLSDDASLTVLDPSIFGCLGRLADLVGYARALELALTGRRMQAIEAARTGLATVVAPADQLDATVDDLVAALLSTPRGAAAEIKAALSASVLDASARRRRFDAELQAAQRLRSAGEQHE